jgi:DNA-binding CsgD family transcriptional regulator
MITINGEVTIMEQDEIQRLQAKTPEQRFLSVLEQEFNYAPKIAQAILAEAQECLLGQPRGLRPGQIRVILLKRDAPHGQPLSRSTTIEVTWTVDAGIEDNEIEQSKGRVALRRVRIQRLLDEAICQGAVGTQEDLARALHVSVRTIKRDCDDLQARGISLPTRGKLKGIGRGQTHKGQIVGRWLRGETYDQIARRTYHNVGCVKRYIRAFARVIHLHQKGLSSGEISLLLQMSTYLVGDYLAIHDQHNTPFCRQRLQEQLERLTNSDSEPKKGGL